MTIQIKKILCEGRDNNMQVIVAVGVCDATDKPVWVWLADSNQRVRANVVAVGVGAGALQADALYRVAPLNPCHGVEAEPGKALWRASIYFDDETDQELLESLKLEPEHGRNPADTARPRRYLTCSAGYGVAEDAHGSGHCENVTELRLPLDETEYLPPCEIGVLLVHGIGAHKPRETLIKFGEPLMCFIQRVFGGLNGAGGGLDPNQKSLLEKVLSHRQDHDGVKRAWERARNQTGKPETLLCAALRVEDTLFENYDGNNPSSTLYRQSFFASDGSLREGHVMLSESNWTRDVVHPSNDELKDWLGNALPKMLIRHVQGLIQVAFCSLLQDCKAARPVHAALSGGALLVRTLVISPLYLLSGMLMLAFMQLLRFLAMAPVSWLKNAVKGLMTAMMSTVGQSCILKISPVRANAIVRAVTRDLDWLSSRCEKIVVVSHSQGAEIVRQVFQVRRYEKLKRWYTLGAGITPLQMLDPEPDGRATPLNGTEWWVKAGSWAACFAFVLLSLGAAFGLDPGAVSEETRVRIVLGSYLGLLGLVLCAIVQGARRYEFRGSYKTFEKWINLHASHDPVSLGPLLNPSQRQEARSKGYAHLPSDREIHNLRSVSRDHTAYFNNSEQVLAPIALDLVDLAGSFNGELRNACSSSLEHYAEARTRRVADRVLFRQLGIALFIVTLAVAYFLSTGVAWREAMSLHAFHQDSLTGLLSAVIEDRALMQGLLRSLWPVWGLVVVYLIGRVFVMRRLKALEGEAVAGLRDALRGYFQRV